MLLQSWEMEQADQQQLYLFGMKKNITKYNNE